MSRDRTSADRDRAVRRPRRAVRSPVRPSARRTVLSGITSLYQISAGNGIGNSRRGKEKAAGAAADPGQNMSSEEIRIGPAARKRRSLIKKRQIIRPEVLKTAKKKGMIWNQKTRAGVQPSAAK